MHDFSNSELLLFTFLDDYKLLMVTKYRKNKLIQLT
jgi:hypothetical protein